MRKGYGGVFHGGFSSGKFSSGEFTVAEFDEREFTEGEFSSWEFSGHRKNPVEKSCNVLEMELKSYTPSRPKIGFRENKI